MSRILITGVTGFLGAHVLHQALEAGYTINVTTRPAKVDSLQKHLGDKVQVFGVDDVVTGDYSSALKGVSAVIHCAGPLIGKSGTDAILTGSIDGVLNIIKQAVNAEVYKIVFTSTLLTANFDPKIVFSDHIYTDKDWFPATKEETKDKSHDAWWFYYAAKTIAEQEAFAFANSHPEADITSINPSFFYGPFAPQYQIGKGDVGALSSNGMFYQNVLKVSSGKLPPVQSVGPINVDVRDVAKAHVLALKSPHTSQVGQKRLFIGDRNQFFSWKDAVEHLKSARPAISDRLPDTSEAQHTKIANVDTSRAAEILGLTTYTPWEKTVEDTAAALLAVEKDWSS
ncbi:NAD-P-binding protein [Rickenella mellea]|uniref:NAD-P-binding protein n=1 Tax=Rickenella mellea TaxID=50990 RepID=A0A4Y7Q7Q9_9AGAM|nr:NAD-P-binding protein [Rickenella mellea]